MTDFWKKYQSEWCKPGVLVVDPATGTRFICLEVGGGVWIGLGTLCSTDGSREIDASLRRAIERGPIVANAATQGVLLNWLRRLSADKFDFAYFGGTDVRLGNVAWQKDFSTIPAALRWALESDDSPVKVKP